AVAGAAAAPAEELDALADHLGDVALVAFLVVVLTRADGALDEHLPSLREVLAAGLRLLSPDDDVVPIGTLLALPVVVVPHLARRDREAGDRTSRAGESDLRILAEIADKDDLVHGHRAALLCCGGTIVAAFR